MGPLEEILAAELSLQPPSELIFSKVLFILLQMFSISTFL